MGKCYSGAAGGLNAADKAQLVPNNLLSGISINSGGVHVTGGIPRKAAATYTPGTEDQVLAAEQYLEGEQIIRGDANLLAENIRSGVSIFGVTGTASTIEFFDMGLSGYASAGPKDSATVSKVVNVTGYSACRITGTVTSNGGAGYGAINGKWFCSGYDGRWNGTYEIDLSGVTGNMTITLTSYNASSGGNVETRLDSVVLVRYG